MQIVISFPDPSVTPIQTVAQELVKSSQFGMPDPRNGYNRNDTEYRVTLVGGKAQACTCYGFHYHGYCKHLRKAEWQQIERAARERFA